MKRKQPIDVNRGTAPLEVKQFLRPKSADLMVYLVLAGYCKTFGGAFYRRSEDLIRDAGVSAPTWWRSIRHLEDQRLLKTVQSQRGLVYCLAYHWRDEARERYEFPSPNEPDHLAIHPNAVQWPPDLSPDATESSPDLSPEPTEVTPDLSPVNSRLITGETRLITGEEKQIQNGDSNTRLQRSLSPAATLPSLIDPDLDMEVATAEPIDTPAPAPTCPPSMCRGCWDNLGSCPSHQGDHWKDYREMIAKAKGVILEEVISETPVQEEVKEPEVTPVPVPQVRALPHCRTFEELGGNADAAMDTLYPGGW